MTSGCDAAAGLAFHVSPLRGVPDALARGGLSGLISVRDPGDDARVAVVLGRVRLPVLPLSFHDLGDATTEEVRDHGVVLPAPEHITAALCFVRTVRPTPERPVLVHCEAGVSRSPTLTFGLACLLAGVRDGESARRIASTVRESAVVWEPNPQILRLFEARFPRADGLLTRAATAERDGLCKSKPLFSW